MFAHSGHVMTLANSIIGVGILAMPFCFEKCGIILAILLLIISNWITRICCHYLIKISLLTRRKSFEFLGFHAFGSSGKLLAELCIIGYLIGTCITYFVVIGDLGPQIVTKMFNLNGTHQHLRTMIMFIVTLVCILPLGMLKNVDSLSTICTASIGFYVCLVIKIILESATHISTNDWTDKVVFWKPAGVLQCLPIISMALSCQMQLFEVFSTINNQSLEKLNGIVRNATWICTFVYIAVGFFGYVAFCTQQFSGNILVNLAPSFSSDVIKIGFVLSVAFSFPLVIFPCRASIYSLLYRKGQTDATVYIPESRFKAITIFIVALALCIALIIPSVELIIGLVGSTIGVAICIMFPAASFRKIILKNTTERNLAQFVLISGFCLMILGTYANLNAIDEKSSGVHNDKQSANNYQLKATELPLQKQVYEIEKTLKEIENNINPIVEIKSLENQHPKFKEDAEKKRIRNFVKPSVISAALPDKIIEKTILDDKLKKSLEIDNKNIDNKIDLKSVVSDTVGIKISESIPIETQFNVLTVNKTNELRNLKPQPEYKENKAPTTAQQTIDKDAIKTNEEIAAEEQKDSKIHDEELVETKKELKQTKELFERTVDELKEELAKQNQETQNLVVEKINQMVEKVEQIERKVQLKEDKIEELDKAKDNFNNFPKRILNKGDEIKETVNNMQAIHENASKIKEKELMTDVLKEQDNNNIKTNKSEKQNVYNDQVKTKTEIVNMQNAKEKDIVNRLEQEKVSLRNKHDIALTNKLPENPKLRSEEAEAHARVYEPHSYKAGELHANAQPEQHLPPPLALLFNASQTKLNESLQQIANKDTKFSNPFPAPKPVAYEPALSSPAPNAVTDKENFEVIRRDLLQINANDMHALESTVANTNVLLNRNKRNAPLVPNFQSIDEKLTKTNCLSDPELDKLQKHSASAILEMQKQSIGRNLKSIDDQAHGKQQQNQ